MQNTGSVTLVGASVAMRTLRDRIARVAATDFAVLIEGETGAGKELVARQIHARGRRQYGPFVAVNCAALVETLLEAELFGIEHGTATGVRGRQGRFEQAHGGTLFLDEVADLTAGAQAKLLRVLQDPTVERVGGHQSRRVDVRVIAATNRDLQERVREKLFRADLFYRLGGVDIRVPPLRQRPEDVLPLAREFLARHRAGRALELSPTAAEALQMYAWPGNVRELQRVLERAMVAASSSVIELRDLPAAVRGEFEETILPSLSSEGTLDALAGRYARLVLDRSGGNKRRACRVLGVSYHTLQRYLRTTPAPDEQVVRAAETAGVARGVCPPAGAEAEGDQFAESVSGTAPCAIQPSDPRATACGHSARTGENHEVRPAQSRRRGRPLGAAMVNQTDRERDRVGP